MEAGTLRDHIKDYAMTNGSSEETPELIADLAMDIIIANVRRID